MMMIDSAQHTMVLGRCRMNNECEKALNMLDDMRASGLYPTDVTYAELIKCMAGRSDFAARAFEFKNQMDVEDMPVSMEIYEVGSLSKIEMGFDKK